MNVAAKVTSRGQVTVPKPVREASRIKQGDGSYSGSMATMPYWFVLLTLSHSRALSMFQPLSAMFLGTM